MPDLSPELSDDITGAMGKLIAETGCGPGSYALIVVADAAPEATLVQYDWWWRPEEAPAPDVVDRFREGTP